MAHDFDMVVRGGTIADGAGGGLFEGDVAIKDGKIAAVGKVSGRGAEEIDAKGKLVTPGFVDVHTHYDGQLSWGERLSPSSGHGVTTVVAGNCGVGFAPCKEADRENLVRLMEGVEDIPEIVMTEGLSWDWHSFPDFLNSIEAKPHDIDYAVLFPHSPLRVFVMGERAVNLEPSTAADRAQMRSLTKEAMLAGAAGFATSRNIFHQSSSGGIAPSMGAQEEELREIAFGLTDAGRGNLQAITVTEDPRIEDYELLHRVSRASGRPLSYTLTQSESRPNLWREVLASIEQENATGGDIKGQVFNRPIGIVLGLETNYHPFCGSPLYVERLIKLPLAQRVAEMRKPEVRHELMTTQGRFPHALGGAFKRFDQIYKLGTPANYEPDASTSVASVAAAQGVDPLEIAYDWLLEQDGKAKLFVAATSYADKNLDSVLELMRRDDTVVGLGDGGAHYGIICDASYTTFALSHWARDRKRERLGLGEAVKMLTHEPAQLYRFRDRGRLAPGLKGDVNIIDMDRLTLHGPEVVSDLPAGGKRLMQTADGFVATIVSGVAIQRDGVHTGALPGHLVRNAAM
jgi:N-acyl-D-aspartate/D-glutamate deacylase